MRPPATAPLPGDNRTRRAAGGLVHRFRRGWAILLSLALVTALLSTAPATAAVPASQAPLADAGTDQSSAIGQSVTLDGTGSTDPDGDELTYDWTLTGPQPGNYTQSLDDTTSATPSFTPALVGTYTATLVVNDGTTDSVADTVAITVSDGIEVEWICDGVTVTAPVRMTRVVVAQGAEQSRHLPRASTWTLDNTPGITSIWVSVPGNDSGEGLGLGTRFDAPADSPCAPTNEPPVADAGPDQDATTGDTVTLDGTASTDPDGDDLTYAWTLTSPSGSTATLNDASAAQPFVIPDLPGEYVATLIVNDGTDDSPADTTTITVTAPANQSPVAQARVVSVTDRVVQLDGSGSSDPDGDDLTYAWTLASPQGSTTELDDPTSAQPSFAADLTGDYTATLVVNDGTDDSAAAPVTVTIANQAPVADAGPDQDATTGDTVALDGTASSDPDGDDLTYAWTLTSPDGSTAELTGSATVDPTFVPDVAGTYTAELIVNDGTDDSAADSVTITVDEPPNQAPVAKLDLLTDGAIGEQILMVGYYSSDPDGDALTYTWDFQIPDGSTVVPEHPIESTTRFRPDVVGTYVITMTVNDGQATASQTRILEIGHRPRAEAGPDRAGVTGDTVTLDGTGSSDPDGDELSYEWFMLPPAGSTAVLDDLTSATPSFTADIAGTYQIVLRVHDGRYTSPWNPQSVVVTDPPNQAPVADAGPDQTATGLDPITLDGTGSSDPDGDELTYAWALTPPNGSTATLDDTTADQPSFTPDVAGEYTASLVVSDDRGGVSGADAVTITIHSMVTIDDVTVGRDLQTMTFLRLSVGPPSPVDFTVTVSDESIAMVSPLLNTLGSKSITLKDVSGTSGFHVHGLANGTTTMTVSAPGYPDTTATITVTDAGFAFEPGDSGTGDFTIGETSDPRSVDVSLHPLDSAGNTLPQRQGLRPGLVVTFNLTNSNDTVGTLTNSQFLFHGGVDQRSTDFDPESPGTTQISFVQPQGFTEPANARSSITATVTAPPEILLSGATVGKDLQDYGTVQLSVAPPEPIDITLSVDDESIAVLATGQSEGSKTITIKNARGWEDGYLVQGLTEGTTTVTGSAPGHPDATATLTVTGAGFDLVLGDFTTAANSPDVIMYVSPFALNSSGAKLVGQGLRHGVSFTIPLTNSNDAAGTLTDDELLVSGGTWRATTHFDPQATGTSTLGITQPDGFTAPTDGRSSVTASVVEPQIVLSDVTVAVGQVSTATVRFAEAPEDPTRLGVWLDGSIFPDGAVLAMLSTSPDGPWTESISFQDVTDASEHTFYVQGVAAGAEPLKAEGRPFYSAQSQLTVLPAAPAPAGLTVGNLHLAPVLIALRRDLPTGVRSTSYYV